ncbi:MAG: SpoIIE family protein phosphatase [Bacteroidetes bacterium]|nr:SpoIIE family protein phosphatase [Bacteroidota bacterium]
MLHKSIAYRLSIYISAAVVLILMSFMAISYFFNQGIVKESIKSKAVGLSSEVIRNVEKQLVVTREIASNVSNQIIFYSQNNHPEILITSIMEKYSFLNAMRVNIDSGMPEIKHYNYFAFRGKNEIVFEAQDKLDYHCINEKRIFEEITAFNEAGWTEVFTCYLNENMVVSYYSPVYVKDKNNTIKKVGQVICELSLADLNDTINSLKIGENGFTTLLAKDGSYVTHPVKDYVLNRKILELPDNVYDKKKTNVKEILDKGLSGELIAYPEHRNFEKHWTYYTRLKEIDWTLVIAIPYVELFDSLYLVMLRMLLFSVIGILAVYLIVTYITNKLIEPLSTVTSQLKKFSNLSGEVEINSMNEIILVSESLDYLKKWHEKFKINQSQEETRNKLHLQDLMQASEIQRSLIKTDFSDISDNSGVDIFAIYKPARIVSGDLFDYFFLDDNNLIFTMGDVCGKGIPAALFMSVAQTIIKSNSVLITPNKIVKKANNELYTTNQHQFFLTLFLGVLNIKTGVLEFCNAAHCPTYILKLNGEIVELSESHGLPLGLYPNKDYSVSKITLEKGDSIIMYTDGITELQNEKNIQFGSEKFMENIRFLVGSDPKNLVTRIDRSLEIYRGEAKQIDDITLMTIKYKA